MDNATEGDDGDFGRTATNVDDHGARRFFDWEADADSGSYGFWNGDDIIGPRAVGGVHDGPAFNGGDAVRHGDDDGEVS